MFLAGGGYESERLFSLENTGVKRSGAAAGCGSWASCRTAPMIGAAVQIFIWKTCAPCVSFDSCIDAACHVLYQTGQMPETRLFDDMSENGAGAHPAAGR